MLTNVQFDQWVDLLENGGLRQLTGQLKGNDDATGGLDAYCCLGVLTEQVLGVDLDAKDPDGEPLGEFGGVDADGPLTPLYEALTPFQREELAARNDRGHSFADIARYLREHRSEFVGEGDE